MMNSACPFIVVALSLFGVVVRNTLVSHIIIIVVLVFISYKMTQLIHRCNKRKNRILDIKVRRDKRYERVTNHP